MTRGRRDSDLRVSGLGLRARFVLAMTVALTLVMGATGWIIYSGAMRISDNVHTDTIAEAVKFTFEQPLTDSGAAMGKHRNGALIREFAYGRDGHGWSYTYPAPPEGKRAKESGEDRLTLWVPDGDTGSGALLGMLFAIMATVVVVGACVALWVASQVSRPVLDMIDDVRVIAKGKLAHRTRAGGSGEIQLLGRAIDRMSSDLLSAQDAELELSMRKREREVAVGVREALLPLATPLIDGYDVGAAFLGGAEFGGDFHDFIEREDGRLGLLVCGVSGVGIPAALVGATARSYLRSELERSDDIAESMRRVNRWLVGDMRRGMFVTALYALVDPTVGRAQVVCAGHRVPLLRYDAEVQQIRVVHPEGIALGFDQGPVFDRRIQLVETPIEPRDRFLLTNSAPVEIRNAAGRELGEKAFYARVLKHAGLDTPQFLKSIRRDLEAFARDGGVEHDLSLVTISREA